MTDTPRKFEEALAQLVHQHLESGEDPESIADSLATQLDLTRSKLPPDDGGGVSHESEPVDKRKGGRISGWDRR